MQHCGGKHLYRGGISSDSFTMNQDNKPIVFFNIERHWMHQSSILYFMILTHCGTASDLVTISFQLDFFTRLLEMLSTGNFRMQPYFQRPERFTRSNYPFQRYLGIWTYQIIHIHNIKINKKLNWRCKVVWGLRVKKMQIPLALWFFHHNSMADLLIYSDIVLLFHSFFQPSIC